MANASLPPARPPELAPALERLAAELLRWNQRINLTGYRDPEEVRVGLFLDALALVPHLAGDSLLDIGSGAGFPGLVLALARPDLAVTLLEPRAKRVSFQKHAIRTLGLGNVRAVQGRAGNGPDAALPGEVFSTVTVKAVGSLADSLALARPYLAPGGRILLPRGRGDRAAALDAGLAVVDYELPPPGGRRIIVLAG
ncbi:MAG: 16S rRNA (guanine(527)-N(7))-methyltransferase RsmG [Desulfarculus sp.]|nr:16S rRNA (guanine(527)-N(7))-methyltransferase RsmG [Desulfarculus sp.]